MSRNNIKAIGLLSAGGSPFMLICILAFAHVHITLWMIGLALLATIGIYVSAFKALNEMNKNPVEPGDSAISGVVTGPDKRLTAMEPIFWRVKDRDGDITVIRRDAERLESTGAVTALLHAAFIDPQGRHVLVLTNNGSTRTIAIECNEMIADVRLNADSLTTLTWA